MADEDARRWDERWAEEGMAPIAEDAPDWLANHEQTFPLDGTALEIACGRGRAAVWLARRGLQVHAVDVSSVAIELAERLAAAHNVAESCRFEVHDLDEGLPDGPPVDVVLCNLFRSRDLDVAVVARLKPGGLLAIAVLSEVGGEPGRFRAKQGELIGAFSELEVLADAEEHGRAWLLARKPGGQEG